MCRNPALMMDPPKKMHLAPHPFRYFPVTDAEDSCSGDQCSCTVDGESYTVDQGRVQLETTSSSESKDMMPAAGEGFGLHLVNCSTNTLGGQMSTATLEGYFETKLGDMSSYDSFMGN